MFRKSLVILVFASACAPSQAQQLKTEAATSVCAERSQVLQNLAKQLENNFCSPDAGRQYAEYLNSVDPKNDGTEDDEAFALRVSSGFQSVYKDGHLRLRPPEKNSDNSEHHHVEFPPSIEYSDILNEDVGFIRLVHFSPETEELEQLRTLLADMAGVKTLVFDLRGHRGGSTEMLDIIFAAIYKDPIELVYMDTRASVDARGEGVFEDGPTLIRINGPDGVVRRVHKVVPEKASLLADAKVILLTSSQTASAAEHFAFAIKLTKRGKIVGENTRGAARFGYGTDLGCGFSTFIPVGQTFDPKSGLSWEASGVEPDEKVNPQNALDEVLTQLDVSDQKIAILEARLKASSFPK